MVVEIGLLLVVAGAAYEYVTNASFKSKVNADLAAVKTDVATLKAKASQVVSTGVADVKAVVADVEAVAKKL